MLELALLHEEELLEKYRRTFTDPRYKYFHDSQDCYEDIKFTTNNWSEEQLASLDKEGRVVGFIQVYYRRSTNSISDFKLVSFKDGLNITLIRDLLNLIDLKFKSGIRKISFGAVVDNPIAKTYEKLILKYGGRCCSHYKAEVLIDGKYCDVKTWELFKEEYDSSYCRIVPDSPVSIADLVHKFDSVTEIRDRIIYPRFRKSIKDGSKLIINLDGALGYSITFLRELFGVLAKGYDPKFVLNHIQIISKDDPSLITDISRYIEEADKT